jgi:hypothetical protein
MADICRKLAGFALGSVGCRNLQRSPAQKHLNSSTLAIVTSVLLVR